MTQVSFSFVCAFTVHTVVDYLTCQSMKVLHWTYIHIGLRLVALIFYFYVTTCGCNVFAKASKFYIRSHLNLLGENNMWLQHKIINFETADVSWVRTHGAHHPALSYHNANIENRAIDIMQRILHPQNRFFNPLATSENYNSEIQSTVHNL